MNFSIKEMKYGWYLNGINLMKTVQFIFNSRY